MNPAQIASPQPVASTTLTGNAGRSARPSAVISAAPSAARLTRTASAPRSSTIRDPAV